MVRLNNARSLPASTGKGQGHCCLPYHVASSLGPLAILEDLSLRAYSPSPPFQPAACCLPFLPGSVLGLPRLGKAAADSSSSACRKEQWGQENRERVLLLCFSMQHYAPLEGLRE